jgi:glycosyltransferase involved in cell wall biosynthesis
VVVVFVTHNYPRDHGDLPGAFLHPLATALRDRGHDVRVVAPADRGKGGREELDGIPVRRVRYAAPARETLAYEGRMQEAARSPAGLFALYRLVRALRRGVRAEAVDASGPAVLHAHWWFPGGLAIPSWLPAVVTLHGTDARLLEQSAFARWLGRRVLRRARVVTAVSAELAETAARTVGRTDVARHVQAMPVESASRPWSRGGGGAIVVARLIPQKRVDLAIRALGELERAGEPVVLTIVGEGPERGALERLAAETLRRSRVRFTGARSAVEVARELALADVMVFPARGEGLGLSALEGLMAGVPVVACTDGGGVVSALTAHGGGVLAQPTPGAIADAVKEARSEEWRAQARRAGERWRQELAPARVAERFEGWYREALGA